MVTECVHWLFLTVDTEVQCAGLIWEGEVFMAVKVRGWKQDWPEEPQTATKI